VDDSTLVVTNDSAGDRYVATLDGDEAGYAAYRTSGDVVTFTHTEVDERFEGHGIGSRLARYALDDVRERNLRVRPLCPFIARFIGEHAEYADLVVQSPQ
jgi:predicted GNAT family acetyltransferase